MIIPTLITERLTLRALSIEDYVPLRDFYASDYAKFVGGPMNADDAWRALAKEIGHWTLKGFGRWSVRLTGSGTPVGIVGLWEPHGWPEPEIGWYIYPDQAGHGYATEAAKAARDYAYTTLNWRTAISCIASDNVASKSVAQKLGCTPEGPHQLGSFGLVDIHRHPRPEAV